MGFSAKQEMAVTKCTSGEEDIQIPLNFIQRWALGLETYLRSQLQLQNVWALSHVATIVGFVCYVYALAAGELELGGLRESSYKLTMLSMTVTFVIVMYRANFEEQLVINDNKEEVIVKPKVMSVRELIQNDNALLFATILLWNFTLESVLKLLPFVIYAMINLSSFFIQEVIPHRPLSRALLPLFDYLELPLLTVASHFDLLNMFSLFKESYESHNGYPSVIYFWVWCLRFESSEISRSSVKALFGFVDGIANLGLLPNRLHRRYIDWRVRWTFLIPMDYKSAYYSGGDVDNEDDD